MNFGSILKHLRVERGLTQRELSLVFGISESTVGMYERNQREPDFETLEAYADYFNVDMDYLTGRSSTKLKHPLSSLPSNVLPFPGTYKVPRIGRIACGEPITAEENIEDYDPVPNFVHADYTLVCKGDSMTGARIFDGDIVCIQQNAEIRSGDIAAVLVDGDEATLKRVRFQEDGVVLWPENPAYAPMVFTGSDAQRVRIIGKATHFISSVR